MQHLARHLARQSGHPEHGDALACLLNALQQAHDNGDTLITLHGDTLAAAEALKNSPHLGDGRQPAILVHRGDQLWNNRNYQQEALLATLICARLQMHDDNTTAVADPALRPEQQQAVALAQKHRLTLINGGPGTGKTHTIARLIAAEQQQNPQTRIALAAPTGKAAKRMEESLAAAGNRLPAQTLHRLLGIGRDNSPRYHRGYRLPYEHIIIDEASMLSLEMAYHLLSALDEHSHLILLGDADQLAAVEPGAILHDLSHHPALQQHRITLTQSQRFRANSGIGRLATVLNHGENRGDRLLAALAAEDDNIQWQWRGKHDDNPYPALFAPYRAYLEALKNRDADPQALIRHCDQYRILCAGHHGALGTCRINAALRQQHQRAQNENGSFEHYHGLPLLILENDHRQQLYNGDTGICLDSPHGLQLHLAGRDPIPLARLDPNILADAYALSIHKSQGSEYPHIALALDPDAERLLSRELLYTGITRSKGRLDLYATTETLKTAADTPTRRSTGLACHLNATNQ